MGSIFKIKESWDNTVPTFKNKVSKVLNSANEKTSKSIINPFIDQNGNLINPYINYQKALNNPNISIKAKQFIQQATGLSPDVTTTPTSNSESVSAISMPTSVQTNNVAVPSCNISSDNNVSMTDSKIVSAAKNYIGTPYVWGGESMSEGGMDCSGFVYNALKDAGYNVGRTTAQGYRKYGTSVSKENMQPGDLVFFGSNGNASHIGIYIGNGQMIHSSGGSKNTASNPGKGVSITDIDYRSDFLEARRY